MVADGARADYALQTFSGRQLPDAKPMSAKKSPAPQDAAAAVSAALPPDIAAMSFEDALQELESIVRELEAGNAGLDESIAIYGRGAQLKRHCAEKLAEAKMRVDRISMAGDGSPVLAPSEGESGNGEDGPGAADAPNSPDDDVPF